ncbi:MAG: GumC family protein, partial [Acidobacteria bacterium]|nr:GumC family protein [Acidobacteriota bacterium]
MTAAMAEAPSLAVRQPEEDGAQALLEYARIARRHIVLISLCAAAGLALGLAVALVQKPIYQARAAVEIERPNDRFLDLENLMPTTLEEPYSIDAELATQMRVMTSRPLVHNVIERLELSETLAPKPGRLSKILAAVGLGRPQLSADDAALAALHVEPSGLSRIVDVYFEDADPEVAEKFANGLADELIRYSVEARWKTAERTAELLSGELSSTRKQLAAVQERLQTMARSNGIVSLAGGTTLAEERLRQIQDDYSRAQSERIVSQTQWEQAKELSPESAASTLDNQALRDQELHLADLRAQLSALATKFKPGYSGVKSLQSQVDSLEAKLEATRTQILERAHHQYDAAVQRETMIAAEHKKSAGVVAGQKAAAIEFDILRQEAETSRELYDNLLRKIKESTIAATISATHIRVVDPATVPPNPIRPQPALTSGLGLALGCMVGMALAAVRFKRTPTCLRPGDIPRVLGAPELACIPTLTSPDALRLK